MNKKILTGGILIIVITTTIFAIYFWKNKSAQENPDNSYACTMDAKMCPDGSYVGRVGPDCQFAQCPSEAKPLLKLETKLEQIKSESDFSITPKEIISDSRCPTDVVCIWEGTVEVMTVINVNEYSEELVLKLNEPIVFRNYTVTLTNVTPEAKSDVKIPNASYKFTFEVKKNI